MSDTQTSVLFICMGNICRSPAAECFFINAIEKLGHDMDFIVDSAGTGGWHAGAKPDKRMRAAAKKQGFVISGSARQVTTEDFSAFDWIFCMDQHNLDDVLAMGANPKKTKIQKLEYLKCGNPGNLGNWGNFGQYLKYLKYLQ